MTLNLVRIPDDDASIPDPAAQGKANAALFVELDDMAKRVREERAGRHRAEWKLKGLVDDVAAHARALKAGLFSGCDLIEMALMRGGGGGHFGDLDADSAATIAQILLLVERAGKLDE